MDKQQQLEQLFQLAKEDQTVQSFGQTKDRFIASIQSAAIDNVPKKQVFTKKWFIMTLIIGTLALGALFILAPSEQKQQPGNQEISTVRSDTSPQDNKWSLEKPTNSVSVYIPKQRHEKQFEKPVLTENIPDKSVTHEKTGNQPEIHPKEHHISPPSLKDFPRQFPKLTEEEIAITKKKKRSMLKALQKHDKDYYAYIPSGSFDYNGKTVSAQAFYMGTTEVTNFEYRTFLFDLIIQNKQDEFWRAKPDQEQWSKLFDGKLSSYTEHYFSDKAYNNYPVVNISRAGAELYCKWLSEELQKFVGEKKEGSYNDVRLPVRAEWAKAASYEGKMLPYPWGGPYMRNSAGLILANYARDTTESTETSFKTSGYDIIAPSRSYFPNPYGIYNMSGNVAEMVYEGIDRNDPGTAGGCWMSDKDGVKIYAPDPYSGITGAKPMIGFRVVSTFLVQ